MRIAHFTDVHFTRKPSRFRYRDLLTKRGVGWLNLTVMRRYKRFQQVAEIVKAFQSDILKTKPDLILFTGDMTAVAYPDEFQAAGEAFSKLRSRKDVFAMLGNHDVYVRKADGGALFQHAFPYWISNDRPDLSGGSLNEPRVKLLGDDIAVIALPSVRPSGFTDSSGLIGADRLAGLEKILEDDDISRRIRIVGLHYAFCLADGRPDRKVHGIRDEMRAREILRKYSVDLVVHGHVHSRFCFPAGLHTPFNVANPGSLTDGHHDQAYHLYHVSEQNISVETRKYDRDLKQFKAWENAPGSHKFELNRQNINSAVTSQ